MPTITFISTVHKEHGKCNSDELCAILETIRPEVIFLEALYESYSRYHQQLFNNYGVYHKKLELAAIQKFSEKFCPEYIPVLEKSLPDSFDTKLKKLNKYIELHDLLDDQNSKIKERGFDYLNSKECSAESEKMRERERSLLNDTELEKLFSERINNYENTMMKNIYSYCGDYQFEIGVFMCGVAHRNSIISKIESFNTKEKLNLNWEIYGE